MITVPFFLFNLFEGFNFIDIHPFDGVHINISEPSPLLYIGGGLGFLAILGFILELVFIVIASLKARDGEIYYYPLTINFLR